MEISHFEGNRPKWLMPKRMLCFWERAGPLKGERRSTYWCMPTILYSSFSILFNPSFLSFFSSFSPCLLICYDSLLEVTIPVFLIVIEILSLCTVRVLYIVPVVTRLYYFSL